MKPAYTIERNLADNSKVITYSVITVDTQNWSLVSVLMKMGLYFEDIEKAKSLAMEKQNKRRGKLEEK